MLRRTPDLYRLVTGLRKARIHPIQQRHHGLMEHVKYVDGACYNASEQKSQVQKPVPSLISTLDCSYRAFIAQQGRYVGLSFL